MRAGVIRTASLLVMAVASGTQAQEVQSPVAPETTPDLVMAVASGTQAQEVQSPVAPETTPDVAAPQGEPVPPAVAAPPKAGPGPVRLPQVTVETKRPRRTPAQPPAPRRIARPARPPAATPTTPSPQPSPSAGIYATPAPIKERYQLPVTAESVTAKRIEQTVNAVDTEDAIKYLPSLFVRKRNYGDNQAVLATRTWGLNSSARSLIYADDVLLSSLIGNNNSAASPHWGMVAPEEIQRIDFLYGPFAAMYPGNSMGGVLLITTKMPEKFEATFKQTGAVQTFDTYNTKGTYGTSQTNASVGNRWNDLSVFVSANYQDSHSQPLAWITTAGTPAGTTGTIPQLSRTGTVANVIGAGGLLHTEMLNLKGKAALDITPWLTATYVTGLWSNNQDSNVQTYLRDAAGNPTFGGSGAVGGAAFASNYYNLDQLNLANALTLKTDTKGAFDGEIVVSRYDYLKDIQRNPFTVAATGTSFIDTGRITRFDGTNWTNADAKGIWRTASPVGPHEVSFGVHGDEVDLVNPVYQTPTWNSGPDSTSTFYSIGNGKTQTTAFWVQDAWRFAPQWKLTLGGRWEDWRAFDGFNLTTAANSVTGAITSTSTLAQPTLAAARFSPKAALAFEPMKDWLATASFGVANRFPTVTELYQATTVGTTLVNPNPNLLPEEALSGELAVTRSFTDGKVRFSLFQENTHNMLISQTSVVPNSIVTTSFVTNVDAVQNRGAELAWQKDNVAIAHLEVFGSVTYVDSIILSDPTFVGTNGSTAVGKHVPNIPAWRTTLGATYRPTTEWAFTVAGRYQSKIYATLDNTDIIPHVFQAFDPFLVVDTRVVYNVNERGSVSFGIDNLGNNKYFLFHSFPQRTFILEGKLKL
jgi:iron complex outermembrane receptor protein